MKKSLLLFIGIWFVGSCIDRVNIPIPEFKYDDVIVVSGLITDQPGPYTVELSNPIKVDTPVPVYSFSNRYVAAKEVTIFDNVGNSEVLQMTGDGIYQTKPGGIRGTVGREYTLRIETFDGRIVESLPDKMPPVGDIDTVYYEFTSFQPETSPTEYGYRIYLDSHDTPGENNYLRWQFTGTYIIDTEPQFHRAELLPWYRGGTCDSQTPYPCSGWGFNKGVLSMGYGYDSAEKKMDYIIGRECTCCRCWVTQHEDQPTVSDKQVISNGKFTKVYAGYVPVNYYTFHEKYRVQIQQMSLSRAAFDYWRAFRNQKEAAGSIFQPVSGKIPSNLTDTNKGSSVQGIFYASAIKKKQIYLDPRINKVYFMPPVDCSGREGPVYESCRLAFPFSTTTKPSDWVD